MLIYQQWQYESIISNFIKQPYGWAFIWEHSVWTYLFFAYYTLTTGCGLLLVVDYWKKAADRKIKHQASIIFITGLFALTVGSLTNVTLPLLNNYKIPAIGHLSLLFWVFGIAYVIIRYRFLTILFSFDKLLRIAPKQMIRYFE